MMDHMPFIIAAFALVTLGTGGLIAHSLIAMRKAEARVEELRRDK